MNLKVTSTDVIKFIEQEINQNNTVINAVAYDFDNTIDIYIKKNKKEIYKKILKYCYDNDIVIESTSVPDYTVYLRIKSYKGANNDYD